MKVNKTNAAFEHLLQSVDIQIDSFLNYVEQHDISMVFSSSELNVQSSLTLV